ncbi:hypothetical protein SAMN05444682_115107 [Parapedobacter indicus]|uniref:HTH cro/C1-type domain-containing protein n=3 Tax=Parapedobacter indicus TaxID=1477437 RepID=A0A1I3UWY0_9SPHI|nr:hypothetical protein CLV26_11571 [Parapedobacter indicus]SFJ87884.1 hypothetical protein SAMN05444682_115107 [Parapedobacter indicus]
MPTMEIKLRNDVVERLKRDQHLRTKLALELRRSYATIQRYVNDNSELLTTATALRIISEELGIDRSDLLEEA